MDPRKMREQVRAAIAGKLAERQPLTAELATLRGQVAAGDASVTDEQVRGVIAKRDALDAELDALEQRERELTKEIEREDAVDRLQATVGAAGAPAPGSTRGPAYDQVARVGQEQRTYNPDTDRVGKQFLRDVARSFYFPAGANGGATERLVRHMQEELVERRGQIIDRAAQESPQERAVGTGAFAGLVVPQYLTEMYAPAATAGRPFANACNGHELPESGMTFNISRITTGTDVGLQATENTAVTSQDIDDTLLPITVQTAAGQQVMSRQAIERGTGTEDVTVQDLFKRWGVRIDTTLINQATTGLAAVATAIAYTDGTPTAAEFYPKTMAAAAAVEGAMLDESNNDTMAVMHSRRWYWLQSQLSTSWPLFGQPGLATQQGGINYGVQYGSGFRGLLPNGMPVIVDNNIVTNLGAGTNEDEAYFVPQGECHLWEDASAPFLIRAEQPNAASLGVVLVLYSYFAYTFSRYASAMQKVGGTGLITPTF